MGYLYINKRSNQELEDYQDIYVNIIKSFDIYILQGLFKFNENSEEFYLNWSHGIQRDLRKQTRKPYHFVVTHYVGPYNRKEKAALFYRSDKVSLDKSVQIPNSLDFMFSPVLFEFSRFSGKSKDRSGVVQKFSLINYRGDDDDSESGKNQKSSELMKLPTLET